MRIHGIILLDINISDAALAAIEVTDAEKQLKLRFELYTHNLGTAQTKLNHRIAAA